MDSNEAELKNDVFLREVPNVKIAKDKKDTKPEVKAELKTLALTDNSQKLIMDTLKHIHGNDFALTDASSYKDKRSNMTNRYWVNQGNLVVKGGTDNIHVDENTSPEDKFRMFALLRLQSYGFHDTHCKEALDYCNGVLDSALKILYYKYYNLQEQNVDENFTKEEMLEQRTDEKNVLQSIYGAAFEERISNTVWVLTFNLPYLISFFHKKPMVIKPAPKVKKKDICRNYSRGLTCKYGNKCRFLHETEKEEKDDHSHLNVTEFELEIRFHDDSRYPFETPLIFLKTNASLPEQTCLRICRRLISEANLFASNGIVSIYSVAELLNNEDELIQFLKTNREKFIDANEPLFPPDPSNDPFYNEKLPTHYRKGTTNKDNKNTFSPDEMVRNDRFLAKQHKQKQDDPTYIKFVNGRKKLPAWNFTDTILKTVKNSQVIVISGETGCGKSTQVPQFILDEWLSNFNDNHIEIVCTQPRRISAIGVAERVSDERAERVGRSIGYSIRLENKISSLTRLTFCTTGILLRRLEADPKLRTVSHIIVDEVHERSEESDFLLLILKDLLPSRPDLKIILMSATMNANIFCDYFGNIPIITIPGRTFPVEDLFLEDILECSEYIMEESSQFTRKVKKIDDDFDEEWEKSDVQTVIPKDSVRDENLTFPQVCSRYQGFSRVTCKNLYLMDPEKVNIELIEHILMYIVSDRSEYPKQGSILVFLPGIAEITALYEQLKDNPEFNPRYGNYVLLPLHSSLSSEEQSAIFRKPKNNARKIVLSTNIAETSVTIDDCVFVIDCGKMKEKRFDPNKNMESLEVVWVSRANAMQRRGRAGRVLAGTCVHLFSRHRFQHHLLSQPVPELHRVPLEQLILRIKVIPCFEGKTIRQVLGRILEPPSVESVESAIIRLKNVGALDERQDLTPLGVHLAELPVDVRIGKLMLFGAIFCCTDAALTMAACLSYKSPFVTPFDKREQANAKKKKFSLANSDQLTVLNAYNKWKEVFNKNKAAGSVFAQENYLSMKTLTMLADIKYQLLELLVSIGFVPVDLVSQRKSYCDKILEITGPQLNVHGENTRLLSAVLCAALYPNVVKILSPEKSFFLSSAGAVPKQLKAEDFRFKTKQDGYVFLHPTSINYTVTYYPSSYLIYQEKMKTSKIFIRDCSLVPNIPLVLFSGSKLNVEVHNGASVILLEDGWIIFQVEKHEVAEMLKMIRIELFQLLDEKIRDPCLNLLHHENGKKIISTIVHIVSND